MPNDSRPSNCRKIHPINAETRFYPGVMYLPAKDTELKITSLVPRVFVVVKAIMNPDITQPNEISIEGVYVERGNAEKFICEQPYDIWTNWTVESYDVADCQPPTSEELFVPTPEYGAMLEVLSDYARGGKSYKQAVDAIAKIWQQFDEKTDGPALTD